jgi:hypothetical protein
VHWHLAPQWGVQVDGRSAILSSNFTQVGFAVSGGCLDRLSADEQGGLGWWSPAYGRLEATNTIRVRCTATPPFWIVSVFDLNPRDPVRGVELLPVTVEAGSMSHGAGARVDRSESSDYVLFAEPSNGNQTARWRIADLETDARMLWARVTRSRRIVRLEVVEGTFVTPMHAGTL